jgi:hypothetical protein
MIPTGVMVLPDQLPGTVARTDFIKVDVPAKSEAMRRYRVGSHFA